jgi:poly(3-hydroxybutyrate) depolymerase
MVMMVEEIDAQVGLQNLYLVGYVGGGQLVVEIACDGLYGT